MGMADDPQQLDLGLGAPLKPPPPVWHGPKQHFKLSDYGLEFQRPSYAERRYAGLGNSIAIAVKGGGTMNEQQAHIIQLLAYHLATVEP